MKTFKKTIEGDDVVTVKVEAIIRGLKAENIFKMQSDLEYKSKLNNAPKQLKLIEQTSKNSDIIYIEVDLPFPMTNRDFVLKRLYMGNKEHPELIKKFDLYEWEHRYYAIIVQSTEREDYPRKDKPVRADSKMNHWLIEEDPNDKDVVKVKLLSCQKMNGNIPNMMMNKAASSIKRTMIEPILDSYVKLFGKE